MGRATGIKDAFASVVGNRRGGEEDRGLHIVTDENGTTSYYLYPGGPLHRENGPAVESITGRREWWVKGKRHRIDGPALIRAVGSTEWWLHGKRHRVDGPAVEWNSSDGNDLDEWWVNGVETTVPKTT